jgi:hypothetical protein
MHEKVYRDHITAVMREKLNREELVHVKDLRIRWSCGGGKITVVDARFLQDLIDNRKIPRDDIARSCNVSTQALTELLERRGFPVEKGRIGGQSKAQEPALVGRARECTQEYPDARETVQHGRFVAPADCAGEDWQDPRELRLRELRAMPSAEVVRLCIDLEVRVGDATNEGERMAVVYQEQIQGLERELRGVRERKEFVEWTQDETAERLATPLADLKVARADISQLQAERDVLVREISTVRAESAEILAKAKSASNLANDFMYSAAAEKAEAAKWKRAHAKLTEENIGLGERITHLIGKSPLRRLSSTN